MSVTVVTNPLCSHYLTRLRDERTATSEFRSCAKKVATLVIIEACKGLRTKSVAIFTPVEPAVCEVLADDIVVVPVLRAGLGMLESATELIPDATVGFFGLARDEETARAMTYYQKLPELTGKTVLVLDPMLATGGSAIFALRQIFGQNPASVSFVCIVAAPEGIEAVESEFPSVSITCGAIDKCLNSKKYIVPGLGDFGDRLYGNE